ncbi:MAG: hypothetical protein K2X27_11545 [Candidatus Obscuribacterales bacterium]|nr:hypothetical protein [Candidatus Obscuribacterales bacterium]
MGKQSKSDLRYAIVRLLRNAKRAFLDLFSLQLEGKYFRHKLRYKGKLVKLSPAIKEVAEEIKREGVCVRHFEKLGLENFSSIIEAAQSLKNEHKTVVGMGEYFDLMTDVTQRVTDFEIAKLCPEVFLFGLKKELLALAENVVGVPPSYLGCEMRKDLGSKEFGVRLFHRDFEDLGLLKICIYLSDVNEETPAFEFLPFSEEKALAGGRCLAASSPLVASKAKRCEGPAGTVVFAWTNEVIHRASVMSSTSKERYTLWYVYGSRYVRHQETVMAVTKEETRRLMDPFLSDQQRGYLNWF